MTIKKKKKTYDQLDTELKLLKKNCLWDNVSKIVAPSIKWGALALIAKFASNAISDLSGKITAASIDLKASAFLNPDDACENWPYWIAAISAIICVASVSYGWNQRGLRKQTIEHLSPYKEKYEHLIDPNRTSSGLLNDGSTNPTDI